MPKNKDIHKDAQSGQMSGFASDFPVSKSDANFDYVWERIRQLTGWKKYGDLADYLRINSASVSGAKKRGVIPIEWAYKVACGYNGSTDWLLSGTGPMRRGETAPQQPATTAQASAEAPIQTAAHAAFDALGVVEGMGLLTKIYSSGDTTYIRAINANLMAFGDAIENRARAETTINAIREMREQMNVMQGDLATLRAANQDLQRRLLSKGDREQNEAAG